jgi:hypothetical protein
MGETKENGCVCVSFGENTLHHNNKNNTKFRKKRTNKILTAGSDPQHVPKLIRGMTTPLFSVTVVCAATIPIIVQAKSFMATRFKKIKSV